MVIIITYNKPHLGFEANSISAIYDNKYNCMSTDRNQVEIEHLFEPKIKLIEIELKIYNFL